MFLLEDKENILYEYEGGASPHGSNALPDSEIQLCALHLQLNSFYFGILPMAETTLQL